VKICGRCTLLKADADFSLQRYKGRDNLRSWCRECSSQYLKDNKHKYLSQKRKQSAEARRALRLQVLQHYSDFPLPFCACCDETHLEFLSIDHIHGGGNRDKKIHRSNFYRWLKKLGFPEGFRVLCHNCNQSLGAYGYCPHGLK
jgi:hypothetical protein